jgi:hypothetical protein
MLRQLVRPLTEEERQKIDAMREREEMIDALWKQGRQELPAGHPGKEHARAVYEAWEKEGRDGLVKLFRAREAAKRRQGSRLGSDSRQGSEPNVEQRRPQSIRGTVRTLICAYLYGMVVPVTQPSTPSSPQQVESQSILDTHNVRTQKSRQTRIVSVHALHALGTLAARRGKG